MFPKVVLDFMDNNALLSTAMLSTIWKKQQKDMIDLITPFVEYAITKTTQVNQIIDTLKVAQFVKSEFGYKSFHPEIVGKVLKRLGTGVVKKYNKSYYLVSDISSRAIRFEKNRRACKEKFEIVIPKLQNYLNTHCKKNNAMDQNCVETKLLEFFGKRGLSIAFSVEDLQHLRLANGEIEYFIGCFIIEERDKGTLVYDYLADLVAGYFLYTAIYLQPDNAADSHSTYKNVTFYFDTVVLLNILGFKTQEAQDCCLEMIKTLQKYKGKLACFRYNVNELYDILQAYKQNILAPIKNNSINRTLEYFDLHRYDTDDISRVQSALEIKLEQVGIDVQDFPQFPETSEEMSKTEGLIDERCLETAVLEVNPSYNKINLPRDLDAISSISRIRAGVHSTTLESCKAIFVTTNVSLAIGSHRFCKRDGIKGVPLVITDTDIIALAWIKDFKTSDDFPRKKLIENALMAMEPTPELLGVYEDQIKKMQSEGEITEEQAAFLRTDHYAKRELMAITCGESDAVTGPTIHQIKENLMIESKQEGKRIAQMEYEEGRKKEHSERLNRAYSQATSIADGDRKKCYHTMKIIAYITAILLLVVGIGAILYGFLRQSASVGFVGGGLLTLISIGSLFDLLYGKKKAIDSYIQKKADNRYHLILDREKEKYLQIIGEP